MDRVAVSGTPPSLSFGSSRPAGDKPFSSHVGSFFETEHARVFAYVQRLSGEPDLAQEAFVRLFRRGSLPESPAAWLITVATNLLRNARSRSARRERILMVSDPGEAPALPADSLVMDEERTRVREALARLSPRDQQLLSMLAGGYKYREMAAASGLREASVGTMLARAKRAFRLHYGASDDAP